MEAMIKVIAVIEQQVWSYVRVCWLNCTHLVPLWAQHERAYTVGERILVFLQVRVRLGAVTVEHGTVATVDIYTIDKRQLRFVKRNYRLDSNNNVSIFARQWYEHYQ